MPTVTETPVEAFAHCINTLCPGNEQKVVSAVAREVGWQFMDNGGDIPGIERSNLSVVFADAADRNCPECGSQRELSREKRPVYQNLSNHDPMYLVRARPSYDAGKVNSVEDEKRAAEMRRMFASMSEKLEAQNAELVELKQRRGPGRPPKAA